MVGTTTIVRHSTGIPSAKSRRGSRRGSTNNVQNQLTSETANWLAETSPNKATAPNTHTGGAMAAAKCQNNQVAATASAPMLPRYKGSEYLRAKRGQANPNGDRIFAARSRSASP